MARRNTGIDRSRGRGATFGGSAAAPVLYAKHQDGQTLQYNGVDLETDGSDFYLEPYHGSLLKVGSPTVSEGSASGFSSTNYFEGDVFGDIESAPCTIGIKLTVPATPSSDETFLSRKAGSGAGLKLEYTTGEDFRCTAYDSGGTTRLSKLLSLSPTTENDTIWVWVTIEEVDGTGTGTVAWDEDGDNNDQSTTGLYTTAPGVNVTHLVGKDAAGTAPFNGTIHEIRVYDSVLTEEQREAVTSDTSPPTATHTHNFPDQERVIVPPEGWSEGDDIDAYKVYGLWTAVVVGAPATGRRSGFDQLSLSNYVIISLTSATAHSFLGRATMASNASSDVPFFGADASGYRWGLNIVGANEVNALLFDNATPRATAVSASSGQAGAGSELWVGGSVVADASAVVELETLSGDGSSVLNSGTDTWGSAAGSLDGVYYIGRGRGSGALTNGTLDIAMGWDGAEVLPATRKLIAEAHTAGASIDDLRETYGADLATDGLDYPYMPSAPNVLLALAGSGDPPTAEYA